MERISLDQTKYFVKIQKGDPLTCRKAVAFTLTPCQEDGWNDWEDVTYYQEGIMDPTDSINKPEWVYVLVSHGVPGICKIGMTTTSVDQRIKEINSATGVITPWFPVYRYKCLNSRMLEQEVHRRLGNSGYRVNPKREGFEIRSDQAIAIIEEIAKKMTVPISA